MINGYDGVTTRFLRQNERLMLSDEDEMPLVIEASDNRNIEFLQDFLTTNSARLLNDISTYGAVLLRGFHIKSDEDFENTVLSIQGFKGISEAFMSEHGRIHPGNSKYVLHTNAVYKTGGTLYLGGFHSENYYSTDVPQYICFCCLKPSLHGGETGLVNMEKVYSHLDHALKEKLEKNTYFTNKWLISEVAERYQISNETITKICNQFNLPIAGSDDKKFILMYKPSVFENDTTKKKSLQINLFELPTLNTEMRKHFMKDYHGPMWFWHRFAWRLPNSVLKILEYVYMSFASLFYSPIKAFNLLKTKISTYFASMTDHTSSFNTAKVGSCFNDKDISKLAQLIRKYYSSCLWQAGDIILVDNTKVAHAGMPGAGPRLVRAMICNPLDMNYSHTESGCLNCKNRETETIGHYMRSADS